MLYTFGQFNDTCSNPPSMHLLYNINSCKRNCFYLFQLAVSLLCWFDSLSILSTLHSGTCLLQLIIVYEGQSAVPLGVSLLVLELYVLVSRTHLYLWECTCRQKMHECKIPSDQCKHVISSVSVGHWIYLVKSKRFKVQKSVRLNY